MAKKKRRRIAKGFSRLTRVKSKAQLLYAHAIVHSSRYQKAVGKAKAKREHSWLVKQMRKLDYKHNSPL